MMTAENAKLYSDVKNNRNNERILRREMKKVEKEIRKAIKYGKYSVALYISEEMQKVLESEGYEVFPFGPYSHIQGCTIDWSGDPSIYEPLLLSNGDE